MCSLRLAGLHGTRTTKNFIVQINILQSSFEGRATTATRIHTAQIDKSFQSYMEKTRKIIDDELTKVMSKTAQLKIHKRIEYALSSAGKRLRPLLVILSAENVGINAESVTKLALAIELMHTATLVHDDILDKDITRRGRRSVQAKWSVGDALLAGDALVSLALDSAADYGAEILKIMAETGILLCEGQYLELDTAFIEISEREYLDRIRKKSASLFKAAAQCGATAGGGSNSEVKALEDFGEHFGMAFQIKDDLADIAILRKRIPQDLMEFRVTLPLIHLYESFEANEKENLIQNLKTLNLTDNQNSQVLLKRISKNLEQIGSLEYCYRRMHEYIDQSMQDIEPLDDNIYRFYLVQMAESLRVMPDLTSRDH